MVAEVQTLGGTTPPTPKIFGRRSTLLNSRLTSTRLSASSYEGPSPATTQPLTAPFLCQDLPRGLPRQNLPKLLDSSSEDEVEAWAFQPPRHMGNYLRPSPYSGSREFKLKIDGYLQIEEFLDWLKTVDAFFDYMGVPPNQQVKLVTLNELRNNSLVLRPEPPLFGGCPHHRRSNAASRPPP
ncbi:hypothetical protein L484_012759 [Morus notabilis]|uniref:Uncharacterized protein n=1 Tax=Morus notabilis TaxID=981085 RepID=W9S6B9_9ROSA|nr:hypothetical protein L484_012759 [Morus notabilis]